MIIHSNFCKTSISACSDGNIETCSAISCLFSLCLRAPSLNSPIRLSSDTRKATRGTASTRDTRLHRRDAKDSELVARSHSRALGLDIPGSNSVTTEQYGHKQLLYLSVPHFTFYKMRKREKEKQNKTRNHLPCAVTL